MAGIDLSRTVGWFTTIAPMRLHGGIDPVDTLPRGEGEPAGGSGRRYRLRDAAIRECPHGIDIGGALRISDPVQLSRTYDDRWIDSMVLGQRNPKPCPPIPDADMGGPYRLIVKMSSAWIRGSAPSLPGQVKICPRRTRSHSPTAGFRPSAIWRLRPRVTPGLPF